MLRDRLRFRSVTDRIRSQDGTTVMEREPPSRKFISTVMVISAILHCGIGLAAWFIEDTPMHWLTTGLFLLAAGGCLHVALRVDSIKVVAWAGSLTLTAYASRAALILYSFLYNDLQVSDARAWLILMSWSLLTLYAYTIFVRGLAPLSRMHRIHHLAREDE